MMKGSVVYNKELNVTVPANASKNLLSIPMEKALNGKQRNEVVVDARFIDKKSHERYDNQYFFAHQKDIDFPKPQLQIQTVEADKGFDVTLTSKQYVRALFLSLDGINNFFSDNYFDLLPNEPVTIHVTTSLSKAAFDKQLKCFSLAEAY